RAALGHRRTRTAEARIAGTVALVTESGASYRRAYHAAIQPELLLELLLTDTTLPRSIAFQLERLGLALDRLPDVAPTPELRAPLIALRPASTAGMRATCCARWTGSRPTAPPPHCWRRPTPRWPPCGSSPPRSRTASSAPRSPPRDGGSTMSEHTTGARDAGSRRRPPLPLREEGSDPVEPFLCRVHHLTSYHYAEPVSRNYGRAHIEPRATPHQRVISHEVVVDPAPARLTAHTDFYGNSSTYLLVGSPHTRLAVPPHAQVTVAERRYLLEPMSRPWEQCLPEHWGSLLPEAGLDFVHPSPRIPAGTAAQEISAEVFTPGRAIGECLADLTALIHSDFTYDSAATTVSSTLEEVLAARHGVCQDFSHVGVA